MCAYLYINLVPLSYCIKNQQKLLSYTVTVSLFNMWPLEWDGGWVRQMRSFDLKLMIREYEGLLPRGAMQRCVVESFACLAFSLRLWALGSAFSFSAFRLFGFPAFRLFG